MSTYNPLQERGLIITMAKGSRGGRRSGGGSVSQSHTGATILNGGGSLSPNVLRNYSNMTDKDAQQLRDDVDDIYDADVTDAIKLYISDSNPNGDGFSHSQNLNYKLDNGMALNPTEKFIDDNIQAGMHDIGKATNLVRYAHDDILKQCGIQDYSKLSDTQLQNKLVGTTFKTTSYMSTSYDGKKNPFNPTAPAGGGREVLMNIQAHSGTKMVFGAKKQAEIVLNKNTEMKITGVHYDGTKAYPRSGGAKPRVVIDIEVL